MLIRKTVNKKIDNGQIKPVHALGRLTVPLQEKPRGRVEKSTKPRLDGECRTTENRNVEMYHRIVSKAEIIFSQTKMSKAQPNYHFKNKPKITICETHSCL